jgi:hypothetical protein
VPGLGKGVALPHTDIYGVVGFLPLPLYSIPLKYLHESVYFESMEVATTILYLPTSNSKLELRGLEISSVRTRDMQDSAVPLESNKHPGCFR